ncbi:DUF590-domain-containing protein [Thelephora ganbajun]|uniref:DUF590-domain-containing protein n=1 Tax=Thelephora ganbajun TaxID=370292 RepID=A0ACB6ZCM6_THEGA|nr:DUF590-domain-containing protein [Thelephora ganbajun]
MHSHVHLVIVFTFPTKSLNKSRLRGEAQNAGEEYTKLLQLLESSGLKAVGKAGRRYGEIIVLVHSPLVKLNQLARLEQCSDFRQGVLAAVSSLTKPQINLPPSHRIRLLYDYLTNPTSAGGLGISPGISLWKRVVGIYPLHDPEFDKTWVRSLAKGSPTLNQLDSAKDNYGEEVGLYFAFLATYTKSLTPIAVFGTTFHFLGERYSPFYSIVIVLWATFFAEYWAVYERKLAIRWGSYGSSGLYKLSKNQTTETRVSRRWIEDFDKLSRLGISVAVLLGFMGILVVITVIVFVLEAFLALLYKGPGSQLAPVIPVIIFTASAPTVLGIYRFIAIRSTDFERNDTSTHIYSLTIKRFILSTIVSYFGIALSAFIYMPFGQEVLGLLHLQLSAFDLMGMTGSLVGEEEELLWEHDLFKASTKLNNTRLQTQMFAFLVTAQLANAFQELGMPYVIRWLQSRINPPAKMKRPGNRLTTQEENLLDRVKEEVSTRLDYDIFDDYCEMITQFGYIAVWSSIWPLAPGESMACLNNWLEGPSDAFKLITHLRKPIPVRVESIGAWLDCIRWIAWAAAVVNTVLVCLYHPDFVHIGMASYKEADFKTCLLIALTASHAFLVVRYVVRIVVDKMYWQHSEEKERLDRTGQKLRGSFLDTFTRSAVHVTRGEETQGDFWTLDEGLDEILRGSKED